jgi:hypothetical protein
MLAMKDMFAELMAYLFAENRRNTSMPPPRKRRLMLNIKSCIQTGNHPIKMKEEDQTNEG